MPEGWDEKSKSIAAEGLGCAMGYKEGHHSLRLQEQYLYRRESWIYQALRPNTGQYP